MTAPISNKFVLLTAMVFVVGMLCQTADAFAPQKATTSSSNDVRSKDTCLNFGIPTFGQNKNDDDDDGKKGEKKEKKIGAEGLLQLITAGMGAPFLGDFEGVDEESGKFMFSLEANNLVDEKGESKQTSMPYFESGWVDPEDLAKEEKRKNEGFKFPWQS